MMKKVVLFILLIVVTENIYGQFLCDDDKGIREFIIKAESRGNIIIGNKCSLFAVELLNPETKLDTKWGIFRIGAFIDHSNTHFLLIKDGKRTYLNTYGHDARALQAIVEFLDSSHCTEKEKLLYLKEAIDVCYRNPFNDSQEIL